MTTATQRILMVVSLALLGGCDLEAEVEVAAETGAAPDPDLELALELQLEQALEEEPYIDLTTLSGACYWGSGQYWCNDYYTKKWCTGSVSGHGWDWTACTWTGWDGDRYCHQGWQWAQSHAHCP